MQHQRLALLFKRAMAKTISLEERQELLELLASEENKGHITQVFAESWDEFESNEPIFDPEHGSAMLHRILASKEYPSQRGKLLRYTFNPWVRVAAAVMLIAVSTLYFFYQPNHQGPQAPALTLTQAAAQYGIEPGSEKAILTLGDGRMIVLDDTHNGLVAEDRGASILKSDSGQLRYDQTEKTLTTVAYNSIRIPKGGQYRLILPDGSRVHLNSESYIKFPTQFNGDRREVELTGEAYFEVSPDKHRPFYVKTPKQVTKVLGTVFNISAYIDETTTKTTLVEGSVEVSGHTGLPVVLIPGQAAINSEEKAELTVVPVDLEGDLAWQKGYFVFNNEPIKHIMRRISRWYDIEVEYQGNLESHRFGGIFQRSKSIAQLLDNFKETGIIDFKIVGRRVVVIEK